MKLYYQEKFSFIAYFDIISINVQYVKLFLHFILVLKMEFNLRAGVWNGPAEQTTPARWQLRAGRPAVSSPAQGEAAPWGQSVFKLSPSEWNHGFGILNGQEQPRHPVFPVCRGKRGVGAIPPTACDTTNTAVHPRLGPRTKNPGRDRNRDPEGAGSTAGPCVCAKAPC